MREISCWLRYRLRGTRGSLQLSMGSVAQSNKRKHIKPACCMQAKTKRCVGFYLRASFAFNVVRWSTSRLGRSCSPPGNVLHSLNAFNHSKDMGNAAVQVKRTAIKMQSFQLRQQIASDEFSVLSVHLLLECFTGICSTCWFCFPSLHSQPVPPSRGVWLRHLLQIWILEGKTSPAELKFCREKTAWNSFVKSLKIIENLVVFCVTAPPVSVGLQRHIILHIVLPARVKPK